MIKFKNFFYAIILIIFIAFSGNFEIYCQIWTPVQGNSAYVNKIFCPPAEPNTVIVSSDVVPTDMNEITINFPYFGVGQNGFRVSKDGGLTFGDTLLFGFSIYDIYQDKNNPNEWYFAARKRNQGGILKSTDGGKTFDENELLCRGSDQILKIDSKQGSNFMVAVGVNTDEGFHYSNNKFEDCLTNSELKIQSRDIAFSPLDPNLLFIAGDDFYSDGVLRSYDDGKTWLKDSSGLHGKRVMCILPSSFNKAWIICGADSVDPDKNVYGKGIYLSIDTGKTWKLVQPLKHTVYGLAFHPKYPRYIAAACGRSGVYLSGSYGWSWEKFNDGLPEDSSVRNIAIPSLDANNDGIILYAGVYNVGLYKSKNIKTSADENIIFTNDNKIEVLPQPAAEFVKFKFSGDYNNIGNIKIFDSFGNKVVELNNDEINYGILNWNIPASINSGIYYISFYVGLNSQTSKFVIIR